MMAVSGTEVNLKVDENYADGMLDNDEKTSATLYMFVLWGVFLPVVAAVGLVGNVLTIIVLWRREMQSTTILYLQGLVITDTGILIGTIITLTLIAVAEYMNGSMEYFRHRVYPLLHTPGYYLVMALQQCNVWITVSVSMERYIAICHPFRAARLVTRRKTTIVLISIGAISLLYNIPHLFATHAVRCEVESSGARTNSGPNTTTTSSGPMVATSDNFSLSLHRVVFPTTSPSFLPSASPSDVPTPAGEEPCLKVARTAFGLTWAYSMYRTVLYMVVVYVIPFLALVILNSFLIKELMTMQKRRAGTNIHDENEANMSLVLVLIVIVFIFCQTPGLVSQFDVIPIEHFFKWLAFANFMFATNSSVNFLIYTAFGRKFRRVLLRVFRHIYYGARRASAQGSYRTTQLSNDYELSNVTDTHRSSSRSVRGIFEKDSKNYFKKDSKGNKNNCLRIPEGKHLSTVHESSCTEINNDAITCKGGSPKHEPGGDKNSHISKTSQVCHDIMDKRSLEALETVPLTSSNATDEVFPLPDVLGSSGVDMRSRDIYGTGQDEECPCQQTTEQQSKTESNQTSDR